MKIFGLDITRNKQEQIIKDASVMFGSQNYIGTPIAKEKQGDKWISFGEDNLVPQYWISLIMRSAIHRACVVSKATMIAGKGIEFVGYDNLSIEAKAKLKTLIENPNGTDQSLSDLVYQWSYNSVAFGAMAIELIKSVDRGKYTQINNIDAAHLRSGKYNNYGKVDTYYYSRHWEKVNNKTEKPKEIHTVGNDEQDRNAIMYFKKPDLSNEYYGLPDYYSAINWIEADAKSGDLQLNNVNEGYQPSLVIKFYKKPSSPEQEDEIVRNLNRQYSASGKKNKVLVMFSNSKEDAPDVDPLKIENFDDKLITLSEQCVQQILTVNRITSPSLLGIPVPSGLAGGGTELESAYKIFDGVVITPEQLFIEKNLQKALYRMGIHVQPKIIKLNPLE